MMDTIATAALIGTGQHSNPDMTTGTPIDRLAAQLADESVERKLLLLAGGLSVYRQAGQRAKQAPPPPEPAAREVWPPCSAQAAGLLAEICREGQDDLLLEACGLLKKAQQRIPHELLPLALQRGAASQQVAAALFSVLGERGHWLSQFNPAWTWVERQGVNAPGMSSPEMERLWEEGTLEQRGRVLRHLRANDPVQGLAWLQAVWKKEKVETRTDFLYTLAIGLSMADQQFLEQALEDRGESVRKVAARFLMLLTASPQARALLSCADDLLQYTANQLLVTPPVVLDKEWVTTWTQDIVRLIPSWPQLTTRAEWLSWIMSQVPPPHWEARFSLSPAQLLQGVRQSEWAVEVINAWAEAAIMHSAQHWFPPLLDWYYQKLQADTISDVEVMYYTTLLSRSSPDEAEKKVSWQLAHHRRVQQAIRALPAPWSEEFGITCLQYLKRYHDTMQEDTALRSDWVALLEQAGKALAPSCFSMALENWQPYAGGIGTIRYVNTHLSTFLQKIDMRKRLIEEIR